MSDPVLAEGQHRQPGPVLTGTRALVVGGYGGIGEAVSSLLAAEGACVVVAGRSRAKADALAARLAAGGTTAAGHAVDVADPKEVNQLVGDVVSGWGGIDVLVNCASTLVVGQAESVEEPHWRSVIETNLGGAFWLSQAVGRAMIAAGRGGRIVHLSSVRATRGARRGFAAYGASKAGVNLLVRQLATEWGPHGITVNAVAPGFVQAGMVAAASKDKEFVQGVTQRTPLGRTATAADVAQAVLYLVSPQASFITGQILFVDGGVSASQ